MQAAETARSTGRPTNDLTAYDLYLRAFSMLAASYRHTPEALSLIEQAIARDPRYGPALGWAAVCYQLLVAGGRSADPGTDHRRGVDFARRALEVAGDDPAVLANAAVALAWFGEDIGALIAVIDRALVLNPSFARGWRISGMLRNWAGQPDIAIAHSETSLRLNPRTQVGPLYFNIGIAHLLGRRFDEAVPQLLLAIQEGPNEPARYRWLASCYAHMGRLDEARAIVAKLRAITPEVVPSGLPFRNPEHRELLLSGLRLAAGEER